MAHLKNGGGQVPFPSAQENNSELEQRQVESKAAEDDVKQQPNCCAKFQPYPAYSFVHRSSLNVMAAIPCYLPLGTAAQQATSAPVVQRQQQRPQHCAIVPDTITGDDGDYVVGQKMCIRAKTSVWKEDLCACNGDECERCNDRYSTVAQNDCMHGYGDNSSIADRSDPGSPGLSSQDGGSETGKESSVAESHRNGASASSVTYLERSPVHGTPQFDRQAGSHHAATPSSQATFEREGRGPTHRAAQGRDSIPLPLERLLTKMSSQAGGEGDSATSEDDLIFNVLTTITNSPTSGGGHDLPSSDCPQSFENIMGGVDGSSAGYPDKYGMDDSEDSDDDDEEGKGKKALLRSDADVRVVQKLFNLPSVTPENAVYVASMPVQELNKLMQQAGLCDADSSLVRDIRRRGKNKVAARNCRKRKIENIEKLEHEVRQLRSKRESLQQERERMRLDAAKFKKCVIQLRKYMAGKLSRSSAGSMSNLSASSVDLSNSGFGSLSQESVAGNIPLSARSAESAVFASLADSTASLAAMRAQSTPGGSGGGMMADVLPAPTQAHIMAGMEVISAHHYANSLAEHMVAAGGGGGAAYAASATYLPVSTQATALAMGPVAAAVATTMAPAAGGVPAVVSTMQIPVTSHMAATALQLQNGAMGIPIPLQAQSLFAPPGAHAGMMPFQSGGTTWVPAAVWPPATPVYPQVPSSQYN